MAIDVSVKDETTGALLKLQVAPETTVDDIIEASADHWRKPHGMYVLRAGQTILRAGTRLGDVTQPDLVLMSDPEGG